MRAPWALSAIVATGVGIGGCNAVLGIPSAERREPSATAAKSCTTHADCLGEDAETDPHVCRASHCVPLLTQPDCPLVLPQKDGQWLTGLRGPGPEPFIVGAFSEIPGYPVAESALMREALMSVYSYNFELVLDEFSSTLGGVPVGGGDVQPVVMVVCKDHYAEPAELDHAVDHLVEQLEVPAVLSMLESDDLKRAFERSAERRALFWNLLSADPSVVSPENEGLLWHMLAVPDSLLATYQPLLDRTLRHLVRTGVLAAGDPARVAIVDTRDVPASLTLGRALLDNLVYNGKKAKDNELANVLLVEIRSNPPDVAIPPNYSGHVQAIRNFMPHVIIAATTDEFLNPVLQQLEAGSSEPEPFYILSPWHIQPEPGWLSIYWPRVVGVNYAGGRDLDAYAGYQARFDEAYPRMAGQSVVLENFYDAPYYLLYSAVAARGSWPLSGPDLVVGMRQLLLGDQSFLVGPEDIVAATAELQKTGTSVTMYGTLGPPNFDPQTGVRPDMGSVWCVDKDGTLHADVLRPEGMTLVGDKFPCFDFDEP
jgi:hypothetical protein